MANKDVKITLSAADKTKSAFASAQQGLGRLKSSAAGVGTALGALGVSVGVGGLAVFAKSGIDAADALEKMSARTGVAVKTLAEYKLAATSADTSLEDLAKGIQKLTLSQGQAEQGGKAQAEALDRLGISAKDPKLAFEQLADAVAKSNNPTKLSADLNAVLGRSYVNMLPLLQGGAQGLRDSADASKTYAEQMEKIAPDAARFNDELDKLKTNAAGAATVLLGRLVPGLADTATRVRELMDEDKGVQALGRAIAGIGKIPWDIVLGDIKLPTTATARIKEMREELAELEGVKARAKGSILDRIFGTPEALEQRITILKNQIVAMEKFGDKVYTPKPVAPKPPPAPAEPVIEKPVRSKADPLAGLLASTDIGKMAAFDAQVAALNERFDSGRKSTELYDQAMTKLVETAFAGNFAEYNAQLAEQDETQRLLAEHLQATNDALYEQQQAWEEAGRTLEAEMRTPLENANIEFGRLEEMLERGVISWETYTRAVFKASEAIEGAGEKMAEMDVFAKELAKNIQQSFADFLFDPFENGIDGMLKSFGVMLQRMIADAVAADLARKVFGDLSEGGSGEGWAGAALKIVGSFFADGGVAANGRRVNLPRFAGGGVSNTAAIFGEAGPEAAVPLPDGRSIPVTMKGGGGNTIVVNVSGSNNAPDVRRAAGQGAREALGLLSGAQRYA